MQEQLARLMTFALSADLVSVVTVTVYAGATWAAVAICNRLGSPHLRG